MLFNLQFVKIKAIDGADIEGADIVTPSRLVENEDTTSSAESVPSTRLFGFVIAAIVPQILFTLDFEGVLQRIETEISVLYRRVLSDDPLRCFEEEMTYLSANSAVAINYFDLVEWLALQVECDFSTVTASLIHFLRRFDIGWIRNVWRIIGGPNCSTLVRSDLQWLGVEILQGAGLKFSVNKPNMGVASWHSDINRHRWAFAMLSRHYWRAAIRAELHNVRALLDQTLG